jgi:hypothetical protein
VIGCRRNIINATAIEAFTTPTQLPQLLPRLNVSSTPLRHLLVWRHLYLFLLGSSGDENEVGAVEDAVASDEQMTMTTGAREAVPEACRTRLGRG